MPLTQRALIELIAITAAIAVLLALAYQVIAPFLVALAWAGILVLVTWKPYERLARLVHSRWLAATLIVLVLGSVLVVPLVFAGIELSSRIDAIGTWYQEKMATGWPPVPHWIATLPLVGPRIEHFWTGLGSGDPAAVAKARELGGLLIALLLKVAAALGQGLLLVVLSLVFALFFYVGGEPLSRWLYALASRIGGAQGRELLDVAGETVIGVVGGALAWGALGMFLGPTLLAVCHNVLGHWAFPEKDAPTPVRHSE